MNRPDIESEEIFVSSRPPDTIDGYNFNTVAQAHRVLIFWQKRLGTLKTDFLKFQKLYEKLFSQPDKNTLESAVIDAIKNRQNLYQVLFS